MPRPRALGRVGFGGRPELGRISVAGGRWPVAGGRWPVAGGRWPVAGGRWSRSMVAWSRGWCSVVAPLRVAGEVAGRWLVSRGWARESRAGR